MSTLLRRIVRRLSRLVGASDVVEPESYWIERHRKDGETLASSGHIDLTEQQNSAQYAKKRDELRGVLERHTVAGSRGRLLDAGCGTGLMIPVYRELGFEVTGMDFASPGAGQAPVIEGVTVLEGDICELPVASSSFDVIACIDVLFHVLDDGKWRRFFERAQDVLAPGGLLVLQVSLRDDAEYAGPQHHVHFRRRRDYDEVSASTGFTLLEEKRYSLPADSNHKNLLVYRSSAA